MDKRTQKLAIFVVACFVLLLGQLTHIQYFEASALANNPNNPAVVEAQFDVDRGDILSSDQQVLAQSVPSDGQCKDPYTYTREYTPATASLFSQIVGFDSPYYGLAGIESEYNSDLVQHTRKVTSIGDLLSNQVITDDVTLTVSTKLQQAAQTALAGKIGGMVAIDPSTGAILAMYSNPTYDPNSLVSPCIPVEQAAYALDTTKSYLFGTVAPLNSLTYQVGFAPGSSFKLITSAAVYDHDPVLLKKSYPEATEISLPDDTQPFHNYHYEKCGGTIAEMLPPSCDTGFAEVGMDLGGQNLFDEATAFGFNKIPPLDLSNVGVDASNFPSVAELQTQAFLAKSAIGQEDDSATPLQMALVAAGIANKGTIMTPHVMENVFDSQGNLVSSYKPTPWLQATTPATAASMTTLMQQVVDATNGTAYGQFTPGYDVAAKTGTAETGANLQYTNDWMVAFAPAVNPQVAIAVVIPDQGPSQTGAETSGPIVESMLKAILGNTNVAPPTTIPPVTRATVAPAPTPTTVAAAPTTASAPPTTAVTAATVAAAPPTTAAP